MKVIINRGAPGSGKSFGTQQIIAQEPAGTVVVASSDDFPGLYDEDGGFHPELLGKSHPWCFRVYDDALRLGMPTVIVDNTNTSVAELSPYILAAQAFGYEIEIRHYQADLATCVKRNTHGVPAATIERMLKALEQPLPPWYPAETVVKTA